MIQYTQTLHVVAHTTHAKGHTMTTSTFDFSIICTESFNSNELKTVLPHLSKLITNPLIQIEVEVTHDGEDEYEHECDIIAYSVGADGEHTGDCGYSLHLNDGEYVIAYLGVPNPAYDKYEVTTNDFNLFIERLNALVF